MKEMKTLETRLRSLKPRRPSAQLRQKLFDTTEVDPGMAAFARWLAPAAACVIFTVMALNHPATTTERAAAESSGLLAMSFSNQHYAAYLPGSFQCEANRLDTFGWTNGGGFPSSNLSVPPGRVNY